MRNLQKTVLITIILFLIYGFKSTDAQSDRLMQDIRVGETILTELITDREDEFPFRGARSGMVRGEYIEGYGVHFQIGAGITGRPLAAAQRRGAQNGRPSPEDERERIEEIMRDYLLNYAVLSRHLADNEHVRLTYGQQRRVERVMGPRGAGGEQRMGVPGISVWVTAADLKRHRSGELSDEALNERIRVSELPGSEIGNDLKVFGSILKTSLDNAETSHLRAGREPVPDYIPGFGVHYRIDASARGFFSLGGLQRFAETIDEELLSEISNIEIDLGDITADDGEFSVRVSAPSIEIKDDSISIAFTDLDDSLVYNVDALQRQVEVMRERFEEARWRGVEMSGRIEYRQRDRETPDYSEDVKLIKSSVEEVIRDYGQTLRSLSDDEFLMITVNWRGRDLPDRTVFRIQKADLMDGKDPVIQEHERQRR